MDWNTLTPWVIGAGLALVLEMFTGTFYLLMVAVGLGAGALATLAGVAAGGQLAVAALVALLALGACHRLRRSPVALADDLDVNATVVVSGWRADGLAEVRHRGASWQARPVHPIHPPHTSLRPDTLWRIVGQDGNTLLIRPVDPAQPTDPNGSPSS